MRDMDGRWEGDPWVHSSETPISLSAWSSLYDVSFGSNNSSAKFLSYKFHACRINSLVCIVVFYISDFVTVSIMISFGLIDFFGEAEILCSVLDSLEWSPVDRAGFAKICGPNCFCSLVYEKLELYMNMSIPSQGGILDSDLGSHLNLNDLPQPPVQARQMQRHLSFLWDGPSLHTLVLDILCLK